MKRHRDSVAKRVFLVTKNFAVGAGATIFRLNQRPFQDNSDGCIPEQGTTTEKYRMAVYFFRDINYLIVKKNHSKPKEQKESNLLFVLFDSIMQISLGEIFFKKKSGAKESEHGKMQSAHE
ncbi:hypothetical protein CEXT_221371 [Caerostris extrusa]|uniref:Uncharacterized protein n=1 Tax=Caerostris extrusa TaxID=172846 RepID=A0AAV4U8S6_CAEEX|nr:hypothetical protein CEXT_221371 [Caerostris extrusa]